MSRRRWLLAAAVLAVVVAAVVVLATRGGGAAAQRSESVAAWQEDLRAWEQERLAEFGPEGTAVPTAPALGSVVLGYADAPVLAGEPAGESVDEVNAACTASAGLAETVRAVPAPPAAPAGLDLEHADAADAVARFDADRAALADFVAAAGADEAAVRQFCGTYPVLVAAHANAAETGLEAANTQLADALSTQCYLVGWEPVCTAGAASAREVAAALAAQQSGDAGALEAATTAADAAHAEAATAVGVGADRAATAAALVAAVSVWDTDAAAARAAFTTALTP